VQVLFDQGVALVVDAGAKLTVNGTSGSKVRFDAKDTGETWKGIYVHGGQLDVKYADFYHSSSFSIRTDAPAGSSTPVQIDHCTIDGSSGTYGGSMLCLWNSPGLTQKVTNTVIENAPAGSAMYLYNCNVTFTGDTLLASQTAVA
jgi:hypothetical protein